MKTLKFYLMLFVVITFLTMNSYSQGNEKTSTYYGPYQMVSIQLPGVPESVTGSYGGWWTVWNFKTQWRAKGTYVGDISGTIYYTSAVSNDISINWMPGEVATGTSRVHIEDEYGTVYYHYHSTFHVTLNANGEITADVFNEHEYFF